MQNSQEGVPKSIGFSSGYMDQLTDPNENFYQYAVGSWLKANPVPPDKSRWGAFNELYDRNLLILKGILEDVAEKPSPEGSPKRLIGDFYRSAMNTKEIERLRFEPISANLRKIDSIEPGEGLMHFLGELRNMGVSTLFVSYSAADKRNSGVYAFYLHQGGLGLPDREYYVSDSFTKLRELYRAHVERMFGFAGRSEQESKVGAETILRIEGKLARASRSRTELRDDEKNYNKILVKDLDQKFSPLSLSTFMKTASVSGSNYVVIGQPEFFDCVAGLVSNEPIESIQNFLRWCVIHSFAPFLHSEVEKEDFEFFHRKLLGQEEPEARWKRATKIIDELLGEALGAVYVEKYFPPEAKRRASQMIEDIREVFKERLATLPWMTELTRRKALEKFEKFRAKIGYPEHFRDYSIIIDPEDYVGNVARSSKFEALRQARRVGKSVDREEWLMSPPTVNAYFHPMENTINFPAGILQPPFFDMSQDDAVNYGGIGVIIGHEITHGYDDQGRKFDAEGNLQDWWTKEDEEGFEKRARDMVDLYNSLEPLPGIHVNGELTLGENIADFGGLSLAYDALEKRLSKEPAKRRRIDGLTPEQRFFISFAQIWRENIREQEIRRRLTVDPHSLMRYRATLPAINHPGFELAFPPRVKKAGQRERIAVW